MSNEKRKAKLTISESWQSSNGQTLQVCVPCELSTEEASVQASVVYFGTSMCLKHLYVVQDMLNKRYTPEFIQGVINTGFL